jgi:hypothetical protein
MPLKIGMSLQISFHVKDPHTEAACGIFPYVISVPNQVNPWGVFYVIKFVEIFQQ